MVFDERRRRRFLVVAGAIDLQTWHAAPGSAQGQIGGGGGRGVSGGHIGGGSGGGGGGNGDAVLVAIVVVVAVVVAIGLVSSEGVRFDGYVTMSSEQPVHLTAANGQKATIPVADLSPGWASGTVEAKVMDDEGFGLRRLDCLPLDRRGATFKLDSGTIAFDFAGATLSGPTMNIQAGYFFTRKLGLLANLGLGGGTATGGLVPRHALGLELQAFPLAWGRIHLGAFGNGGMAITEVLVGPTPTYVNGPSVGGGALAELDLTSRLALTLRAGASLARLDQICDARRPAHRRRRRLLGPSSGLVVTLNPNETARRSAASAGSKCPAPGWSPDRAADSCDPPNEALREIAALEPGTGEPAAVEPGLGQIRVDEAGLDQACNGRRGSFAGEAR